MAYYSKLHPTVYHEYKNCSVGNNMVKGNLKKGTLPIVIDGNPLQLCETCAALGAAGTGIPGIPVLPEPYGGDVVETYYSKESPKIFHMCQNCFLGQNIEKKNLVPNQPPQKMGRKKPKLCKICVKLCIGGKCITGAPIPADKIKSPYYSSAHTPTKVFHACHNCYIGNKIQKSAIGRPDEARLCRICYRLLKEDKCT
ncbi:hypothetical protein ES708_02017 [subsurface metagenome]